VRSNHGDPAFATVSTVEVTDSSESGHAQVNLATVYEWTKDWDKDLATFFFSKTSQWTVRVPFRGEKNRKLTYSAVRRSYAKLLKVKELDAGRELALWNFLRSCFCIKMHGGSPNWFGLEKKKKE
jgi:hypothetical protein